MEKNAQKLLLPAVIISFAVKLMLAAAIPVTSDEAYFTLWGRFLDFGYYDHPPMVGWLLYLVSFIGRSALLIRLPAVLSTIVIALGIYLLLKPLDENKAALVTVFLLVSPLNILNVLITTDTPLIFFSFVSVFFLYLALKNESYLYYVSSGVALGAAFLSKYFAVFLGIAYLVYFVLSVKDRKRTQGFALLLLCVLPFAAFNIYWNYTHCWANIMFNLFNRNKKEEFSLLKPLLFLVSQAYLITPAVIFYLAKRRREIAGRSKEILNSLRGQGFEVFAYIFAVPLFLFSLFSLKKVIGLHWVLGFYPFMYVLLFFIIDEDELLRIVRFTAIFTAAHLFLIGAVLSVPVKFFQSNRNYSTIILGTKPAEVRNYIKKYEGKFVLATPSYADSALLTYHLGEYFIVFGGGSFHGRQDDILTDFRQFDGKDIVIIRSSEPQVNEYSTYFKNIEVVRTTIDGAQFYFVSGYDFEYENYRNVALKDIREKYYDIPSWLPYSRRGYFFEKYFN